MGNKTTKRAASGNAQYAADVLKGRLADELRHRSDPKYAAFCFDRMSVESNKSEIETSEHSHTPSAIEEMHDEEVKEEEEYEDVQYICEIREDQGINQFSLAADRDDAEAVRILPMPIMNVYPGGNNITHSQSNAALERLINKKTSVHPRNGFFQTHSSIIRTITTLLDIHGIIDVLRLPWEQLFYLAATQGQADVMDELLQCGNCNFVSLPYEELLHVAVKEQHTTVVDIILKHSCMTSGKLAKDELTLQKDYTNLVASRAYTPITIMKSDGRSVSAEIVWAEISTPLEIMQDSCYGYTALEFAVESKNPEMVEILLNIDRCAYSEKHLAKSFRCMLQAITSCNFEDEAVSNINHRNISHINNIKGIAHVLMNSSKFNVNHQDDQLNSPLHDVIQYCANFLDDFLTKRSRRQLFQIQTVDEVLQLLLEKGADFNMRNAYGESPLIMASERGCCHIIQTFFDWEQKSGMKLDVDARDEYGATALIKAAKRCHVAVMRLLLNHKVSVNLHDYYGFTALHAAVYAPTGSWLDLHFFCKKLRKQKLHGLFETFSRLDRPSKVECIENLEAILKYERKTTRFRDEMVKLLLAIDETNVNAIDIRGNTPLDLALMSSKRITSETIKALKNRGAIIKLLESKDEAPIHEARVDERGRNPLHRLIISRISNYACAYRKEANQEQYHDRIHLMADSILLRPTPEYFRRSATAADEKGRTPLHYAAMSTYLDKSLDRNQVSALLKIGSNANATDMYGKIPLHYAKTHYNYYCLVHSGADESTRDKSGHTPRNLWQLRDSVTLKTDNANELLIRKRALYTSSDVSRALDTDHVAHLSKRKVVETVRIYSQSPRPKESAEEAIWQVWVQNEFLSLNRRVSQLRSSIQCFVDRLADSIKESDPRFECEPILVGGADEETKAFISADFDFNFKLTKFSKLCDVFPHPLGPKGYFQLRRSRDKTEMRQRFEDFACFFNLDQCLLTNKVNSRFQIVLEDVLRDNNFWKDEHLFEWNLTNPDENKYENPAGLCKTVGLRMINPIEDGEGDFIFIDVSIDIVACVHVDDAWLGDELPIAVDPSLKADGCTMVFDRPRFDLSKSRDARSVFSDTFARISFAPLESRIIRESSFVIKAAYMVCKLILYDHPKTTYQLKTCLLFCMEALKVRRECERKCEDKIRRKELAFWVERLMFCFMELCRHDGYPCYFMSSFRQRVVDMNNKTDYVGCGETNTVDDSLKYKIPFHYSSAFAIYLDLCPDDAVIDIPIIQEKYAYLTEGNQDPTWEQFDREEFIGRLSSRCSSY